MGRRRAGHDEIMKDDSTGSDYCQGNGTKFVPFESRRNKGNGWKGLAGIYEFGETEKNRGWD